MCTSIIRISIRYAINEHMIYGYICISTIPTRIIRVINIHIHIMYVYIPTSYTSILPNPQVFPTKGLPPVLQLLPPRPACQFIPFNIWRRPSRWRRRRCLVSRAPNPLSLLN